MIRRPPRTTRTYPLVPYTTLCRSLAQSQPNQGPNAARLSGELHRSLFGGAPRKQSLDLVGGPLNRELQRLVDMDIVLRHILRGMTQHRSEEHTSELQSLMRISYAVFCLKKKQILKTTSTTNT